MSASSHDLDRPEDPLRPPEGTEAHDSLKGAGTDDPAAGEPPCSPPSESSEPADWFSSAIFDDSVFDEALGTTEGESPPAGDSDPWESAFESEPPELRHAFGGVAGMYLGPVKQFVDQLRIGAVATEQIRPLLPPLGTVSGSARSMGLAALAEQVDVLADGLGEALRSGAKTVDAPLRETLVGAWEALADTLPESCGVGAEGDPLDGLLLRTLLRQVPALDAHSVDNILGAGFTSAEMLSEAASQEVSKVTGIASHVCEHSIRLARAYVTERRRRKTLVAPSDWVRVLEPKLEEVQAVHREIESGEGAGGENRRRLRRQRERGLLEIEMLLVEMGQLPLLLDLQRQRFERRLETLGEFVAGLRKPSREDLLARHGARQSLQHLDLRDLDLEGIALAGADLAGSDLTGANLAGADLRHAVLVHARLKEAFLQGADLTGAKIRHAHLEGASFANATLLDADLSRANLESAHLEGAHLDRSCLRGARLGDSHLGKASLVDADLRGANLADADAGGADLERADLRETALDGTNLKGANLRGADLRGCFTAGANLDGARLEGAKGLGADPQPADPGRTGRERGRGPDSGRTPGPAATPGLPGVAAAQPGSAASATGETLRKAAESGTGSGTRGPRPGRNPSLVVIGALVLATAVAGGVLLHIDRQALPPVGQGEVLGGTPREVAALDLAPSSEERLAEEPGADPSRSAVPGPRHPGLVPEPETPGAPTLPGKLPSTVPLVVARGEREAPAAGRPDGTPHIEGGNGAPPKEESRGRRPDARRAPPPPGPVKPEARAADSGSTSSRVSRSTAPEGRASSSRGDPPPAAKPAKAEETKPATLARPGAPAPQEASIADRTRALPSPAPVEPVRGPTATAPPLPAIVFEDPNLDRCVRAALSRPEGTLTPDAVATIEQLDCSTPLSDEMDVTRLGGIEALTNLTRLDLSFNGVTEITPLASLSRLEFLNLRGNKIADIAPLSRLPKRCEIDLWQNPIEDITPLLMRQNGPPRAEARPGE